MHRDECAMKLKSADVLMRGSDNGVEYMYR